MARLTGTWLLNSAQQTLNYHGYEHNLRNDITRHTRTDASFVDYDYDDLGQLTDAVGSGGQSVELLAYGYDTGWNMTSDGTTGYFVNDRNQVTGMTDGTNLGYDAHGNLLGQDNWNQQYGLIYTYDAENRLTRVEEDTYYKPNALRTEFVYDGLSRLRIRKEYLYTSGWALTGETRYLYDGRRVIQERSSANTPTVTYTRGNDLSGSLEGAGGIGGMLARSHGYSGSTGNWSTHNYYHADAGGNITCLINSNNGITAIYRYDPFGRTLFQSGTMANANVYRFSSKEVHGFTGMYYYGFRFYDPTLQRWINRDPIGEVGGFNLYGFVRNNPGVLMDPYGLDIFITYEGHPPHPVIIGDDGSGGCYKTDFGPAPRPGFAAWRRYGPFRPGFYYCEDYSLMQPNDVEPYDLGKSARRIRTTPAVDKYIAGCVDSLGNNTSTPSYNLFTYNCVSYAMQIENLADNMMRFGTPFRPPTVNVNLPPAVIVTQGSGE